MKKIITALFALLLTVGTVEAAKNYLSPVDCPYPGHPTCDGKDQNQDGTADDGIENPAALAFQSVAGTNAQAANIKDCQSAGYATQTDDTVSISGNYLNKTTGYQTGGIFCPGTFVADDYFVWILARTSGSPTNRDKVVWWDTDAPTRRSFGNSRAAYIGTATATFCSNPQTQTGCNWIGPLKCDLDFATINTTQTHGTDPCTVALSGNGGIWLTAGALIEFDAIYISGSSGDTPVAPGTTPEEPPASPNGIGGTNVTTLQFTYKTVGAGDDRLLLCGIGGRTATATVTGVSSSVDGAFTLVQSDNNSGATTVRSYIYRLLAPTSGDHVITTTFSSAQNAAIICQDFEDVDQTTPLSAVTKGEGTGNASTNIASATDETVVDVLVAAMPHSNFVTVGAGQTAVGTQSAGIEGPSNRAVSMSRETGAATTTMSWTQEGGSNDYVHQLIAVLPVGAGVPPSPVNYILNKGYEDSSLTSGSVKLAGCEPGGHTIAASPVRTGTKSLKARLNTSWNAQSAECANGTFLAFNNGRLVRSESDRFSVGPSHGAERWYGFSAYVDPTFTFVSAGNGRQITAQWHANTDACDVAKSPHFSISISGSGNWITRNIWDAAACTTQNPPANDSDSGETITTIGPVTKGVWTDWVVRGKWSFNTDGILQVWQQVNGGGYTLVIDKSGRNTYNDQQPEFQNIGIYDSDYANFVPNPAHDQIIYYDNWRITDSTGCFDAVDPSVASPAGC